MEAPALNKSRIAKNTGILYIRMLVMMFVSLFTSRITIEALGVTDFGVFNVVGGTIGMLSILTSALSSAVSRYTTFELGKEKPQLGLIFSTSLSIQIALSLVVVVVSETIGLWFINNQLNIPEDSMTAANYVYQTAILSFVLGLVTVPYHAQIIAYERMSFYAWISIIDVVGKLGVSYVIMILPSARLQWFSIMWAVLGVISFGIVRWYCKRHFPETRYKFVLNKPLIKEMFGFAGWNMVGSTAAILRDQGGNIIINIFFGPALNAARGVATQVSTQVQSLSGNFTMALNPQITKSYAMGEKDYTYSLISQGARFSFFLMMVLSMPILFNVSYILNWWLVEVPKYSEVFVQLVLVFGLVEMLSRPLITLMLATGRIKWYQIIVGGAQLLNLPLSYLWLKLGGGAESVLIVAIFTSILCLVLRLIMLNRMISFPVADYFKDVCLKVFAVTLISLPVPMCLSLIDITSFPVFLAVAAITVINCSVCCLFIGCRESERKKILHKIGGILMKLVPSFLQRVND